MKEEIVELFNTIVDEINKRQIAPGDVLVALELIKGITTKIMLDQVMMDRAREEERPRGR